MMVDMNLLVADSRPVSARVGALDHRHAARNDCVWIIGLHADDVVVPALRLNNVAKKVEAFLAIVECYRPIGSTVCRLVDPTEVSQCRPRSGRFVGQGVERAWRAGAYCDSRAILCCAADRNATVDRLPRQSQI